MTVEVIMITSHKIKENSTSAIKRIFQFHV